ncbi:unnamed protein product [Colletotrichum noveboracense]|uniref:Uncharacterized protein n=1 Tax=Colletotrichum noveboracense TaxID=2664923 RepID=A0A9W4S2Z8_9PEZI|nr:unnamed protein product [Colletotrichum noveboracense]
MVAREFPSSRNYTFYPQAFHPRYRNFSSSQPPMFLNSLYTAIRGLLQHQEKYTPQPKRPPRNKGVCNSHPNSTNILRIHLITHKRQTGGYTAAYLQLTNARELRILICFFCAKHKSYIHLFRLIPLKVFPRVIYTYSYLFKLALGEIERRYICGGKHSLSLAHSKAVAVLDQLGRYTFTGYKRHLLITPYINLAILGLDSSATSSAIMNMRLWLRSAKTGRLMLLHINKLWYYYGNSMATYCETEIWFDQLGKDAFRSPSAITSFMIELLREI